jgi:hypothetical protein
MEQLKEGAAGLEMNNIPDGSKYWLIVSIGQVEQDVWRNDSADKFRYRTGNYFATEDAAYQYHHWLGHDCLIKEKIKELNNNWVPDFENERHYFFTYNELEKKAHLDWGFNSHTGINSGTLIRSKEIGEQILFELSEETIEHWLTFKR